MARKIAIVTGASRGIGRATAIRLAKDCGGVVVVARSADLLNQTADTAQAAGAEPLAPGLDLRDPSAAQTAVERARRLAINAWEALKASNGSVIFTSGNSAQAPKSGFAAVATVNAAIVATAKAFADSGVMDGVQVNSVLPGPVMTDRRRSSSSGACAKVVGCG
jgi:3-oxoacyl-[acyl-carrier protein] reductase